LFPQAKPSILTFGLLAPQDREPTSSLPASFLPKELPKGENDGVFFTKHGITDNGIVSAHRRRATEKGCLAARVSISIRVTLKDKRQSWVSDIQNIIVQQEKSFHLNCQETIGMAIPC
jgi:hypothetical protein